MCSDVQWGIDTAGFYGVQEGVLTTIRLADVGATGDDARHTVPQIALGGWGGETIAFSPRAAAHATFIGGSGSMVL
ncbi:hypothetical protein [Rhizobium mongolense]|uniref:Uncharacterized protein n=1 Tax=Rhizobium mongolense TaxID=57676 RepID=A0A7W6RJ98_9HYPH|nr:hypothetical protein [Rhizobium mongolense]MBB4272958.1 hypothetical protein [Rhizobium mongolense]